MLWDCQEKIAAYDGIPFKISVVTPQHQAGNDEHNALNPIGVERSVRTAHRL